jgi:hypothetical protein
MSNFLTMIQRIADEVDDGGIDTQIRRAIDDAIRHHGRRRFYFNQKTFTFTTVAAQEDYTVTDAADIESFLRVQTQYLTSGGIRYPITVAAFETIHDAQNGSVTGRPTNWAFFAQKFRLYPIPDGAYEVTVAGHCKLATLVNDTDTNAWMTEAEELIRESAKRRLYMTVIKEPLDAQASEALESIALSGLMEETKLRRGNLLLRVDPALVGCQPYDINVG